MAKGLLSRGTYRRLLGYILFFFLLAKVMFGFTSAASTWGEWTDRAAIVAGFFLLLFGFVFREATRLRKEKYANIGSQLHSASHNARDVHSLIDAIERGDSGNTEAIEITIRRKIQSILDDYASAMSMITGTTCRSSIKMFDGDLVANDHKQGASVFTYLRDTASAKNCEDSDSTRRSARADLLEDNSDFKAVYGSGGKRYYFSNDLTGAYAYLNSQDPDLDRRDLRHYEKFLNIFSPQKWKLGYCSCIVFPIRQKKLPDVRGVDFSFSGFLTVDSQYRRVFNERFDVEIGALVADLLHPVLSRLNRLSAEQDVPEISKTEESTTEKMA